MGVPREFDDVTTLKVACTSAALHLINLTDCYGKSFKAFVLSSRNIDTLSAISLDWTVVGSETSGS